MNHGEQIQFYGFRNDAYFFLLVRSISIPNFP